MPFSPRKKTVFVLCMCILGSGLMQYYANSNHIPKARFTQHRPVTAEVANHQQQQQQVQVQQVQQQVLEYQSSKPCQPNVQRIHKTHSVCSERLHTEPATMGCSAHCPSAAVMQHLCAVEIHTSMENDGSCVVGDEHNICMSVDSRADVHMQYFSWREINFFAKTVPYEDRSDGILASFVSNCVKWRRDYLTALTSELQSLGQIVHNYGACAHNADQATLHDKYADKKRLSLQHKFLFAFENSETEGYITEKLFYALSDGAVAVYRGAPNVLQYLPSPSAALVVPPSMPPVELARLLVREAENKTAYDERLAWKSNPAWAWVAQMDLSISHSHCRACQRILDMESPPQHPHIRMRERGFSAWVDFAQNAFGDFLQLCHNISLTFGGPAHEKPRGAGVVVHMYNLWDRNKCPITSIQAFNGLRAGTQLEVVMENPGWVRRGL